MCLTIDVKAIYGVSSVQENLEPSIKSTVSVKIPGRAKPIEVEEAVPVEVEATPADESAPQLNNVSSFGRGNVETTKSNVEFTILLVGETGTGKTSFLSLLVNVLAGRAPDEYDLEPYDVTNESGTGQMHSQTNAAKIYKFKSMNGVQVTVLDTPGLADTRGLEKDNEHKQSITTAIRDSIPEVTAVIILANGTNPRLGVATDYAITTLSSIFPRTLADNIGLLFTNISSPLDWNFEVETLPVELQGVKTFLLDNPLARHKKFLKIKEKAEAQGSVTSANQAVLRKLKKAVDEGHETALCTLAEIFDWLDGLVPQATTEIALLYDQSMEIERNISSTLARMTQLVEKKEKLDELLNKSDGMLLCYSNCHVKCHLDFTLDPMKLSRCWAFPSQGACQVCNHSIQAHQHYNSLWFEKHETEDYVDARRKRRYDEATKMFKSTQVSIKDVRSFIDIIGKEMADATEEIGRLAEEYAKLSLSGSFSGQVKKSVKVLETHLEAIRNKTDDASVKRMEASLEQLRGKLRVLEVAADVTQKKISKPTILERLGRRAVHVAEIMIGISSESWVE
ncbi:uncharacterized protein LACBIDRAFT_330139 [Laccaria bicolor S238N-H82]|uniref:Predicted protein n=1 Tax=Laccaria bicolor (strain S238N-H82 / ATCC MYA-4686) TaxID=486041 RepID=B0DKF1_LACBS|nr:uncharacterized protein LACBIDRAFT_330139 [Laccaria bicolor S238N-H82]EDR04932.1 predicted protein [Laccaria bicolor S238N-H82]|eukprot:XP_001884322.1 predicted protein [Laccaria bicolor S238N-H82]